MLDEIETLLMAAQEPPSILPALLRTLRMTPLWPRRERMVLRGTVLVPHRSVPVLVSDRARF